MRKICTVLLLNFLRSTSRPKVALRSCAIALAIIAAGLFATAQFNKPTDAIRGQHANAVASDLSSPNASDASPADNQPAKTANPQTNKDNKSGNKSSGSSQSNSGGSASAQASASAEFVIKNIALEGVATVCDGQQPAYAVQSAHLATSTSIHGSGAVRWYWETRVDSAESTDTPPINPQTYTQNVSAGSLPVTLQSGREGEPLIKAPTSSSYSYSFRLHVLGPNDVTSDWVSVPVVLDNSCASQS